LGDEVLNEVLMAQTARIKPRGWTWIWDRKKRTSKELSTWLPRRTFRLIGLMGSCQFPGNVKNPTREQGARRPSLTLQVSIQSLKSFDKPSIDCRAFGPSIGLLGSKHCDHLLPLLGRWLLQLGILGQIRDDVLHHTASFFHVGHFSTTEHDGDLDLVFVLKKPDGLTHFGQHIMVAGLWTQANFLGLRLVRFLTRLFVLFVFVFAEVHDSANGRTLIGRHFHKIQASVPSAAHGFFYRDDSVLSSIWANDA
jgi:hypothetical protein